MCLFPRACVWKGQGCCKQALQECKRNLVAEAATGTSGQVNFSSEVTEDDLDHAFDKYIEEMSAGKWGDNMTLYALAQHYQREILLLTDNPQMTWCRIAPDFGNPINVIFYGEVHYDAVQIGPEAVDSC